MKYSLYTAKDIWYGIKYLSNDYKFDPIQGTFEDGREWWDYWNGQKVERYSYKWCCCWCREQNSSDAWEELFQRDEYLNELCKKQKVTMIDQLIFYAREKYCR